MVKGVFSSSRTEVRHKIYTFFLVKNSNDRQSFPPPGPGLGRKGSPTRGVFFVLQKWCFWPKVFSMASFSSSCGKSNIYCSTKFYMFNWKTDAGNWYVVDMWNTSPALSPLPLPSVSGGGLRKREKRERGAAIAERGERKRALKGSPKREQKEQKLVSLFHRRKIRKLTDGYPIIISQKRAKNNDDSYLSSSLLSVFHSLFPCGKVVVGLCSIKKGTLCSRVRLGSFFSCLFSASNAVGKLGLCGKLEIIIILIIAADDMLHTRKHPLYRVV